MINPIQIIEGSVNQVLNKNEELVITRRLICSYCDHYNSTNDSCLNCGCHIDKKGRVERAHCPIKKW